MKTLLVTIGLWVIVLSGCTQQHYANSDAVRFRLQERQKYNITYDAPMTQKNRYGKRTQDYGPQIDIVKTIWGD
ncbi:MAG: hypothetical protein ABFR90_06705 [Planctomycetota bacterium]